MPARRPPPPLSLDLPQPISSFPPILYPSTHPDNWRPWRGKRCETSTNSEDQLWGLIAGEVGVDGGLSSQDEGGIDLLKYMVNVG